MTKFVADFVCPLCKQPLIFDESAHTLSCKCSVTEGVRFVNKSHYSVLKEESALMVAEAKT